MWNGEGRLYSLNVIKDKRLGMGHLHPVGEVSPFTNLKVLEIGPLRCSKGELRVNFTRPFQMALVIFLILTISAEILLKGDNL